MQWRYLFDYLTSTSRNFESSYPVSTYLWFCHCSNNLQDDYNSKNINFLQRKRSSSNGCTPYNRCTLGLESPATCSGLSARIATQGTPYIGGKYQHKIYEIVIHFGLDFRSEQLELNSVSLFCLLCLIFWVLLPVSYIVLAPIANDIQKSEVFWSTLFCLFLIGCERWWINLCVAVFWECVWLDVRYTWRNLKLGFRCRVPNT